MTVHYNTSGEALVFNPACGSASPESEYTRDRRRVRCENCKNSQAWKGGLRAQDERRKFTRDERVKRPL